MSAASSKRSALASLSAQRRGTANRYNAKVIAAITHYINQAGMRGYDLFSYLPDKPLSYPRPALHLTPDRPGLAMSAIHAVLPVLRGTPSEMVLDLLSKASDRLANSSPTSALLPEIRTLLRGMPAGFAGLLFSPPVGSKEEYLMQFAAEAVMFLQTVLGYSVHTDASSEYVETDVGRFGVVRNTIVLPGLSHVVHGTPAMLRMATLLDRGMGMCYGTLDIMDCVYIWSETVEQGEAIRNHILHLRALDDAKIWQQAQKAVMACHGKRLARNDRITRSRLRAPGASYEKTLEDFTKVDVLMEDSSISDITRLLDVSEILVPVYMADTTFQQRFGVSRNNIRRSTLTKERARKWLDAWNIYRDTALQRAKERDAHRDG